MELRWTEDGRECAARFAREEEARRCAALLQGRDTIQGLLLLNDDGERLSLEPSAAT